jgi:GT2 family glycosyltransferase
MEPFIEINTGQMKPPGVGDDLFQNRAAIVGMQQTAGCAEVSIVVQAYNRLEKTKRCVESVLKYTKNVDYELILLDNGSEDGTLDYFQSVPYEKKTVIHVTRNIGVAYPILTMCLNQLGRFVCFIPNDLIVTAHWLENLLICIKSDDRIGMVNPVCSNTSNLQCVEFTYKNDAEMQEKARQFNRSDPRKWEDRQRLITLGTLYRKEALLAIGWPVGDVGFFHDFGDDDNTFRIRRMGYRAVLAGDTWVCHDHRVNAGEGKDPEEFQKSLHIGRKNFQEKYFGVDAWDDVNNYYIPYLPYLPAPCRKGGMRILGIDVKCGTPILDLKNWLRKAGLFDGELSAFTQDPKYWMDLKTICTGPVVCDREEFLPDSFLPESFDYVVADRPVNRYHEPQKILNDLFSLCRRGGVVICKLKNTFSFQSYLHQLGQKNVYDPEFSYHIPVDVFQASLERLGKVKRIAAIPFGLAPDQQEALKALLPDELGNKQEAVNRLSCKEYLFIVEKGT